MHKTYLILSLIFFALYNAKKSPAKKPTIINNGVVFRVLSANNPKNKRKIGTITNLNAIFKDFIPTVTKLIFSCVLDGATTNVFFNILFYELL